jgi:Dihydrodipicolinate synthetase family
MVTPFDKRGEVDQLATEAVVERLIEAGVDGISALGSTGEFSRLTNHNSAYRSPRPCVVPPCPPWRRRERGSRIRPAGRACQRQLAREIR